MVSNRSEDPPDTYPRVLDNLPENQSDESILCDEDLAVFRIKSMEKEKIPQLVYQPEQHTKRTPIRAIPYISEERCREVYPYFLMREDACQNQDTLLNILDTIPVQIWILDDSLRYQICNHAHSAFIGTSLESACKQNFRDLVPPTFAEAIIDATAVAALSSETVFMECDVEDRRGDTQSFLVSITQITIQDQEKTAYLYSAIDITHTKIAEAALEEKHTQLLESYHALTLQQEYLRKSEERYRHLFSNLTSGFAVHEIVLGDDGLPSDYRFLEVNPAFEEMTGLKAEDLIGRTVLEVLPGTEPYWIEMYGRVAMTGESIHFEEYSREIQKYFTVSAYSPQPGLFATLFLDITERRCIEMALKKSEAEYRSVVSDQTEFICRFLPDTTHTFANDAYCRYYQIARDDLINRRFQPQIHPDDRKEVEAFFAALTGDHPVSTIEHRVILPDGNVRWQRWTDRAICDDEGNCSGYQSVGKDITDQKYAEEARNNLLREKDILLQEIHHRVKNNLQLISGLLDMTCLRSTDAEAIDILTETRMRILLMAHIHERLYQSRNIGSINLLEAIKDQSEIISQIYAFNGRNIRLSFNDTDCSIPVSSAVPLALIANEILTNCYKHAFIGRREGTIECEIKIDGTTLSLTIRDDGVGIPEQVDPFQVDSLGLKLVRTLVLGQMKGQVTYHRKNGTRVHIEVPLE
ncbi:PAS domain S-box protein, partial [Methanocalculus sp.]|uniref:sensor histidine kinase n=1 Tax=Methanocalculus sp. TaxID=2004547 RepID=UPI002721941A